MVGLCLSRLTLRDDSFPFSSTNKSFFFFLKKAFLSSLAHRMIILWYISAVKNIFTYYIMVILMLWGVLLSLVVRLMLAGHRIGHTELFSVIWIPVFFWACEHTYRILSLILSILKFALKYGRRNIVKYDLWTYCTMFIFLQLLIQNKRKYSFLLRYVDRDVHHSILYYSLEHTCHVQYASTVCTKS